jgi:VanZ family protein
VLAFLLIAQWAGAYYPFEVTLDPSTVWSNIKHIGWIPFPVGVHPIWLGLLVEKTCAYAAIGYLVVVSFLPDSNFAAAARALVLCVIFAVGLEFGKLFFAGRSPNTGKLVFSGMGLLIGKTTLPVLSRSAFIRAHATAILIAFVIAVSVYSELSPFDWVFIDELPARLANIEWLPFSAYYGADPRSALFDLGKKFFLIAPLGFLVAFRKNGGIVFSTTAAALFGGMLEVCQIALRSRKPSVTDVIVYGIAAWAGAVIFRRASALITAEKRSKDGLGGIGGIASARNDR